MKQFKNYDKIQATIEREQLPKGAYICVIKNAEVKEYKGQNGDLRNLKLRLILQRANTKTSMLTITECNKVRIRNGEEFFASICRKMTEVKKTNGQSRRSRL